MRLIIVDDDRLVVQALKTILQAAGEIEVVATGGDGQEAVALFRRHQPDILLMDIRMQKVTGLAAAREIIAEFPAAKILLLTTFSDDEYIVAALKSGVRGYILKQDYETIIPALGAVASGQTVFGSEVTSKLPQLLSAGPGFDYPAADISPRELELIRLVAAGHSNREIAEQMFLSEGTVRNYLSNVLEKLELRDRTQLAVFYLQNKE